MDFLHVGFVWCLICLLIAMAGPRKTLRPIVIWGQMWWVITSHRQKRGKREAGRAGALPEQWSLPEAWPHLVLPWKGDTSLHPFHRKIVLLRKERGRMTRQHTSQETTAQPQPKVYYSCKVARAFPTLGSVPHYSIWWKREAAGGSGGTWRLQVQLRLTGVHSMNSASLSSGSSEDWRTWWGMLKSTPALKFWCGVLQGTTCSWRIGRNSGAGCLGRTYRPSPRASPVQLSHTPGPASRRAGQELKPPAQNGHFCTPPKNVIC